MVAKWDAIEIVSCDKVEDLKNGDIESGKEYTITYVIDEKGLNDAVGLVQEDIVNASMNGLLRSTMLLVGAVVFCIAAFFIGLIIQKSRASLRRKDTEILYRDELFQKLSMNVDDVFLMLDEKTYQANYISPNVEKLLGMPMVGVDPALVLCYRDEYKLALGEERGEFNVFHVNNTQIWL